jgi:hypothetical protein
MTIVRHGHWIGWVEFDKCREASRSHRNSVPNNVPPATAVVVANQPADEASGDASTGYGVRLFTGASIWLA